MTSHTLKLVSLIVFHIFHKIHVAKLKIFFAHPMDPLSQPSWKAPPLGSTGVLPSVLVNLASSWVTKKLATASIPSWALKSTVWMFEKVERRDWASPNLLSRLTNRKLLHSRVKYSKALWQQSRPLCLGSDGNCEPAYLHRSYSSPTPKAVHTVSYVPSIPSSPLFH